MEEVEERTTSGQTSPRRPLDRDECNSWLTFLVTFKFLASMAVNLEFTIGRSAIADLTEEESSKTAVEDTTSFES